MKTGNIAVTAPLHRFSVQILYRHGICPIRKMKQEKRSLHMEDVLSMGFCILQNIFVPLQYSFKLGVLYMVTTSVNKEWVKLKDLSSAFSRSAFVDVLNYNDYSHFNWLASKYDTLKCTTYFELLKKSYSLISKYYRCEYVYKNEGYVVNNLPLLI